MKKILKRSLQIAIISAFSFVLFIALGVIMVFMSHKGSKIDDKIYDYGIVFGAAIRSKGRLSATLKSRMDTAILLYKEGSIKKLVLSGAKKNIIFPGEPVAMKNYAISKGVDPKDTILDEKGDNTFLTILNTKNRFSKEKSFLFISSFFHLARIKISAKIMGVKNFGTYPSSGNHPKIIFFVFRESVAIWFYLLKASFSRIG